MQVSHWRILDLENGFAYIDAMTPLRIQITELREAKGWTQTELAERAGLRRATLNRYERGHVRAVDLGVLEKLSHALGVAPGLLIVEMPGKGSRGRST
jgi:transcriptional regulator with XRE-family HTH domain